MDILVTVGVIVVLIALTALLIHLLNVHHGQRIAETHYDRFHAGDPPDTGGGGTQGEAPRDQRRDG